MSREGEVNKHNLSIAAEQGGHTKVSPCGRFERHDQAIENIIGVDVAYVAMDLEDGIEVVWSEYILQDPSALDLAKIRNLFDRMLRLNHPSLIKYYTYWIEEMTGKNYRLYYVCEQVYLSLLQFIKRTKPNKKNISVKTEVRWCKQILLGLEYLHSLNPAVIPRHLRCENILMSYEGSVKILIVTLNKIFPKKIKDSSQPVDSYFYDSDADKDVNKLSKNMFDFGRIAYFMATLELIPQSLSSLPLMQEQLSEAQLAPLDKLPPAQKEFILTCLKTPEKTTIQSLMRSKFLYEVPSLKLLTGHILAKVHPTFSHFNVDDVPIDGVFATLMDDPPKNILYSELPSLDTKKYILEISRGMHPLTGVSTSPTKKLADPDNLYSSTNSSAKGNTPMEASHQSDTARSDTDDHTSPNGGIPSETRQIIAIQCRLVRSTTPHSNKEHHSFSASTFSKPRLKLILLFREHTSRHMETDYNEDVDTGQTLTDDLIMSKLIPERNRSVLITTIDKALKGELVTVTLACCK